MRNIISDDDSLQDGVLPALQEYNLAQFITVEVPGTEHQVSSLYIFLTKFLLTTKFTSRLWARLRDCLRLMVKKKIDSLILDQRRASDLIISALWVDPASLSENYFWKVKRKLLILSQWRWTLIQNHSGKQELELLSAANQISQSSRAALESSTLNYLLAHYHDGVASVFSVAGSNKFFVQIVANKYNPSNYWCVVTSQFYRCSSFQSCCRSGRWRSEYIINLDENKVDGKILANVHYYEQGNVRCLLHCLTIADRLSWCRSNWLRITYFHYHCPQRSWHRPRHHQQQKFSL